MTIPRWGSRREARAFAERERAWIDRQLARVVAEGPQSTGMIPVEQTRELRARARRELPARLLELAARHGVTVSRVSIRNQRWRWGSCSPSGHICLNWRLLQVPDWVRDYVLVHELMHLKRMDHSPRFWELVAGACPGSSGRRHPAGTAPLTHAKCRPWANTLGGSVTEPVQSNRRTRRVRRAFLAEVLDISSVFKERFWPDLQPGMRLPIVCGIGNAFVLVP